MNSGNTSLLVVVYLILEVSFFIHVGSIPGKET